MKSTVLLTATLVAFADALPEAFMSLRQRAVSKIAARVVYGVQQPVTVPEFNKTTVQGCFKSAGDLALNGSLTYNDINSCGEQTCKLGGFAVGATMGGSQCYCGQTYPPKEDLVDPKNCNIGCKGYDKFACE